MKRLSARQKQIRKIRRSGWHDFHAGKTYDDSPPGERARAEWVMGWRAAKEGEPEPYKTEELEAEYASLRDEEERARFNSLPGDKLRRMAELEKLLGK